MLKTTKRPRYFAGWDRESHEWITFRDRTIPTFATHGDKYGAVLGPYSRKAQVEQALNVQRRGWY